LKIVSVSERLDFDVLVALAFADEQIETQKAKYGTYDSQYSFEEYS
jgi:hypothetical protein